MLKQKINISIKDMNKYQISNLNEIPEELIGNARKLDSEFEAESYLNLLVTPENSKYLRSFVRQVVINGEKVNTWKKGRALIVDSSLVDQLTKDKEEIFGYDSANFKTIIRPNYEAWSRGSDFGGMFVFCEPDADYRSYTPPGYGIISLKELDLIEVDQKHITTQFRRWLASRMAAFLKHKNQLETFDNAKVLEELVTRDQWTEDAVRAFEGLGKEKATCSWGDDAIPGFCGDDAFYGEI
ncbi:hypothetical protein [Sinomicrobium sp. M5D2P17]